MSLAHVLDASSTLESHSETEGGKVIVTPHNLDVYLKQKAKTVSLPSGLDASSRLESQSETEGSKVGSSSNSNVFVTVSGLFHDKAHVP